MRLIDVNEVSRSDVLEVIEELIKAVDKLNKEDNTVDLLIDVNLKVKDLNGFKDVVSDYELRYANNRGLKYYNYHENDNERFNNSNVLDIRTIKRKS